MHLVDERIRAARRGCGERIDDVCWGYHGERLIFFGMYVILVFGWGVHKCVCKSLTTGARVEAEEQTSIWREISNKITFQGLKWDGAGIERTEKG